jgi:hypothetical protein
MNSKFSSAVFISLAFSILKCFAQTAPPIFGSTNDLWDVSRGCSIIRNSPLDAADGRPHAYDALDIFGGQFGSYPPERGFVIFTDGEPSGFVHFVEWRTQTTVTIRSFSLYAFGDLDTSREFASFKLMAKSPGSTNFDITMFTFKPTHPYTFANHSDFLLISTNVNPTTAQDFRAEFVNRTGVNYTGPRVVELDGFGDNIGVQATIRTSEVEISWDANLGVLYQVEYLTDAAGGAWLSLGSPIQGNGTRATVTDKVAVDSPRRFYRVQIVE